MTGNLLTVIQPNDSHAYFDLNQEMRWLGNKAVYRPAGGYARIATLVKQIRAANEGLVLRRRPGIARVTVQDSTAMAGAIPDQRTVALRV